MCKATRRYDLNAFGENTIGLRQTQSTEIASSQGNRSVYRNLLPWSQGSLLLLKRGSGRRREIHLQRVYGSGCLRFSPFFSLLRGALRVNGFLRFDWSALQYY